MALTKKDLFQIQELLTTQLSAQDSRLRLDLREAFAQQAIDIRRDIRDEMDARFMASERRMDKRMDEKLLVFKQELKQEIKQEVRSEFMNVLAQNILPAIDRAYAEIGAVRRFVGMT